MPVDGASRPARRPTNARRRSSVRASVRPSQITIDLGAASPRRALLMKFVDVYRGRLVESSSSSARLLIATPPPPATTTTAAAAAAASNLWTDGRPTDRAIRRRAMDTVGPDSVGHDGRTHGRTDAPVGLRLSGESPNYQPRLPSHARATYGARSSLTSGVVLRSSAVDSTVRRLRDTSKDSCPVQPVTASINNTSIHVVYGCYC